MTPDSIAELDVEDLRAWAMTIGLVSARLIGVFSVAPIFGSRVVPRNVRAGLILSLAFVVAPSVRPDLDPNNLNISWDYVALQVKELGLGIVLGMLLWMPIRGIEFAGVLIDTQRGSTTAQDFDVIFNAQTTPTAIFLSQTLASYYFAAGGFLLVCNSLFHSYQIWSIPTFFPQVNSDFAQAFLEIAGELLLVSVIFVLPVSMVMLLADIGIAFIAKMAPTLNALTFAMPVKSALSLIMLIFFMDMAFPVVIEHFASSIDLIDRLFSNER